MADNQTVPIAPITQNGLITHPTWTNFFNWVVRRFRVTPEISSGIIAPTSTPTKIGNIYIDTVLGKVYISTGTTNSADWKILN